MEIADAYRRHRDALFRFASRHTGDPDWAEDVVQEAFIRLSKQDGVRSERQWIFTVAANLIRDRARQESRRRDLMLVHTTGQSEERADVASSELERDELRALVRKALDSLSEKERTILLMREEGFSHREIAEAVGTTTGSVGSMIARALKKIAPRLAGMKELLI